MKYGDLITGQPIAVHADGALVVKDGTVVKVNDTPVGVVVKVNDDNTAVVACTSEQLARILNHLNTQT